MGKYTSLAVALFFALVAAATLNCKFDPSAVVDNGQFPQFEGDFQNDDNDTFLKISNPWSNVINGYLFFCIPPRGQPLWGQSFSFEGFAETEILADLIMTRANGQNQPMILLHDEPNDTLSFRIGEMPPSAPMARRSPFPIFGIRFCENFLD